MAETPTVLVVDNERHIVHIIAIKLRNHGYEVISTDNGAEAFELAIKERPNIIVTDTDMPNMTGLELVGRLRQNEKTENIPVIMLTTKNLGPSLFLQNILKISACFSKPFIPQQLLDKIEEIFHQKELATN